MPQPSDTTLDTLLQEQERLRREIDRLREEQQRIRQDQEKSNDQDKSNQEPDKEEKDQKEKEPEKSKQPFIQRARTWAQTHPLQMVLGLLGLVVLLVAGYFLWQYLQSYESTDDAQVDGHTNQISSRISGTVVGVYVENSQRVVRGQLVVDLDPKDYRVALEQAQANLAQAVSSLRAQNPNVSITETSQQTAVDTAFLQVTEADAGLLAAQQSYQSAMADLDQAKVNADNAAREEQRYKLLVDKQEVSREQYDQWATQARSTAALVIARRSTADAALRTMEQRQSALAQAKRRAEEMKANQPRQVAIQHATLDVRQANLKTAQAQVDQAALNLSYCRIQAPVDGIVGDKTVELGMQISPGQELFAISRTDDIWVTANFKETQIRKMHPGQSVTIHVDALSQDFNGYIENMPGGTGAIYSLLPPENATGNYVKVVQRLPVRIRFKAGQPHAERLRPGMSVEPKVWVQ